MKTKLLDCGGTAVYSIDPKTKQEIQVAYIGPGLPVSAWLGEDKK
jgi:hypothetical protein